MVSGMTGILRSVRATAASGSGRKIKLATGLLPLESGDDKGFY